jgi:hypothetical protein
LKIGKWKFLAAGALSAAALVAGSTPAYAGTDIPPTRSTDSSQGAGGKFTSSSDTVQACDMALDGMRARVWLSSNSDPRGIALDWEVRGSVDDAETNGQCVNRTIDVPEGHAVKIEVCRFRVSDGTKHNCRTSGIGHA